MRTLVVVLAIVLAPMFVAEASAPVTGSRIEDVHVVSDVATCTGYFRTDQAGQQIPQQRLASGCGRSFARGLVLFAFTCTGCDVHDTWVGRFVVNGRMGDESDIVLSPALDAAWSVRPGQFGPGDCVAITLSDVDASPRQTFQSQPVCSLVATPAAGTAPAAAAPSPVSPPPPSPVPTDGPAAPLGLAFTSSIGLCAQHAGSRAQVCASGLLSHAIVFLLWDAGCAACGDGYDVFTVAADGTERRVAEVLGDVTVVALGKSESDGQCFTVRAFKGSSHSPASQPVCYRP